MSTKRGNTFLIGVVGQNDLFQDFSISVRAISPPPIISLLPSGYSRDITIRTDAYSYFSVPVDSALEGKISITVELLPAKGALPNGGRDLASVETLTQQLGRGLYTVDSLTASVLALEASDEDKPSPAIKDTLSRVRNLLFWHSPHSFSFQLSSSASFLSAIPPSIAKSEGLFPLAYFSDHSFFPTSHFYVWRASSLTGAESFHRDLRVEIYFSVIAATFMSPVESPSLVSFPFTHPSS